MTKSEKAWEEYQNYKHELFGGPGSGCDDYRYMTEKEEKRLRELYQKYQKEKEKEGEK